ncbi:hypothetical protein NL676_019145 [Syzygium grande]|nr:hypothetical protein NL676_019145 [Syzygium grande]
MQRATCCSLSRHARFIVFFLVCYPIIPFVSPVQFNISSFDCNSNDIIYEGVAEARGIVDLTPHGKDSQLFQVGRIKYSKPIHIGDSVTGRQADFSTHFSFTIEPFHPKNYSDGLAFFLAPTGFTFPPNSAGGYLGLFNSSIVNDGPWNQIVMVEFDTFVNRYFDPPGRHAGININSPSSLVHSSWDPEPHGGNATNVVVTYNSTSKNLSVFWSFDGELGSSDKQSPSLSYRLDLAKVLPDSVVIGISASCGIRRNRHIINSWGFTSDLDVVRPPSTNSSLKGPNSRNYRLWANYRIYRLFTFITAPIATLMLIISTDPKRRPKAGQVIRFLQLEVPVPELPPAAFEAPTLFQPPALRIGSSSSSQEIVVLSKMDHGS